MDQVWMNLLSNAIRFTPAGGAIATRVEMAGDAACVSVSDTGIGIAAGDQPRIFERFFKADPARTREAGGSGLGLALVKRIVELHGGRVRVESRLGGGSTFRVTLPVTRSSRAPRSGTDAADQAGP
jgi:signal transduction histidine kinase